MTVKSHVADKGGARTQTSASLPVNPGPLARHWLPLITINHVETDI